MNHPDPDYRLIVQRHEQDIAAADRWRLAKLAEEAENQNLASTSVQPALPRMNWLRKGFNLVLLVLAQMLSFSGNRLLVWGCRLQTHSVSLSMTTNQRRSSPCA